MKNRKRIWISVIIFIALLAIAITIVIAPGDTQFTLAVIAGVIFFALWAISMVDS